MLLGLAFATGLTMSGGALAHHTDVPHQDLVSRTHDCAAATCSANGGK